MYDVVDTRRRRGSMTGARVGRDQRFAMPRHHRSRPGPMSGLRTLIRASATSARHRPISSTSAAGTSSVHLQKNGAPARDRRTGLLRPRSALRTSARRSASSRASGTARQIACVWDARDAIPLRLSEGGFDSRSRYRDLTSRQTLIGFPRIGRSTRRFSSPRTAAARAIETPP